MRIIAGKYKGKKLKDFVLETTRPTSDLVRGALFNILTEKVNGSVFLDLFAGTGANFLEALSRNAKFCYANDINKQAINLIKENLKLIDAKNYLLLNLSSEKALKHFSEQSIKFNIIFLDPPYKTDLAEQAIKDIIKYDLLFENGVVVWEHDREKLSVLDENIKTKKYGNKYLSVISKDDLLKYIKIQNNV